jgi:hypothetical protein
LPAHVETARFLPDRQQEVIDLQFLIDQKDAHTRQKHHARNLKKEFVSTVYFTGKLMLTL